MMKTHDMFNYMRARLVDDAGTVDASASDPVLIQAQHDGYAERVDGKWIFKGHIQPGERRIVRHLEGGQNSVVKG